MAVVGEGARGRLERLELWGNADGGVRVGAGGHPTLAACTIRDHTGGKAHGVWVTARSEATVGANCVFARNAGGDVVRAALAPDAPPGMAALRGKTQAPRPALHPHALTYAQAGNDADDRYCSVCEVSLTDRSGAFRCDFCDYDACIACFEKEVVARG